MASQPCNRCGKEEYIPTFQYVKFDGEVKYLCQNCWEAFRKWFNIARFGKGEWSEDGTH